MLICRPVYCNNILCTSINLKHNMLIQYTTMSTVMLDLHTSSGQLLRCKMLPGAIIVVSDQPMFFSRCKASLNFQDRAKCRVNNYKIIPGIANVVTDKLIWAV
jgi:hypothetical protein